MTFFSNKPLWKHVFYNAILIFLADSLDTVRAKLKNVIKDALSGLRQIWQLNAL